MRKLAAAAFSFAAAVAMAQYLLPDYLAPYFAAGAAVLSIMGFGFRGKIRTAILISALSFSFGILWCCAYERVVLSPYDDLVGDYSDFTAVVTDYPESTDYGYRTEVRVFGGPVPVKAMLYTNNDSVSRLEPGDEVDFAARCARSTQMRGKTTDIYTSRGCFFFLYAKGAVTVSDAGKYAPLYAAARLAKSVRDMIKTVFPEDTRALFTALLTGDRTLLYEDVELETSLTRAGIYHIVCISGMHVSMLAGFVFLLTGKNRWVGLTIIPILVFYAAMTGFSPSVTRAVIMQSLILIAPVVRGTYDPLTAIGTSLLAL